ncbi:MAG: DUF362 domain-containing protein [Desulfamplus sp.]|nr:DUF362 domain-containing protein [Desulfamplus sp.]
MQQNKCTTIEFFSFETSVPLALDAINADQVLKDQETILVKPNLVNSSPHPITTSPDFCRAMVKYIVSCSKADVIIAEGCGDADLDTHEIFHRLGYEAVAKEFGADLVDLNHEPLCVVKNNSNSLFKEMYLPEIAFRSYIVSLPVLKAHSLADVTGTLKNMMGFAPPKHYSHGRGSWKKGRFHNNMQQSIIELNRFITPDLTLMDASIGMAEYHLGGPTLSPPAKKLIAGYDPVCVDQRAAELLGLDPQSIEHLCVR